MRAFPYIVRGGFAILMLASACLAQDSAAILKNIRKSFSCADQVAVEVSFMPCVWVVIR